MIGCVHIATIKEVMLWLLFSHSVYANKNEFPWAVQSNSNTETKLVLAKCYYST